MSKQSEAKERQGYVAKAIPATCSNCAHFTMKPETVSRWGHTWTIERNKRCGKGGFAVKKMGTCNEHEFRVD